MPAYPSAAQTHADADRRQELAQQLLARAEPVAESDPCWDYLTKTRRLPEAAVRAALPELRHLASPIEGRAPQDHAVVSLLRDERGEISGLQLTFIDVLGAATATQPRRQSYSLRPNGCRDALFAAGGGAGARSYLVEGYLEKAIAVASLGLGPTYGGGGLNVLGFAIPPEQTVVIVPDRAPAPDAWAEDGKTRLLDQHTAAYQRAIDRLILAGKTVLVAAAPDCPHKDCMDADSFLIRHGEIRLRDLLERAASAQLSDAGWRKRLAEMSPEEYARRRKELAKDLGFTRVADVDAMRAAGKSADHSEPASAAEKAVAVVVQSGAELWCDDGDDSFATFTTEVGASASAKVPSLRFEDWLRDLYGTAYEREIAEGITAPGVLSGQAYEEAWKTVRSMARRGPIYRPCIRIGHAEGKLYLDLADKTLERPFVEVRHTGEIELVAAPAVRLVHMSKALPLPVPVLPTDRAATWAEFDTLSGAAGDRTRAVLTRGYLFAALFQGPHVGSVFTGDPGAGKTTAATVVKAMIDPAKAGARLRPRTIEDFIIGAYGGWLGLFDNLSGIAQDFSDVACKILDSTGISRRTLYTTADETVIELGRPLAFTSINDHLVWSPDLIDRVIVLHSERIDQASRLDEDDVLLRAGALRPQLLGLLLQATATALRGWQDQDLTERPRRVGVAKWIETAHVELGLQRGEFLTAYMANQQTAMRTAATTNPVVAAVLDFMDVQEEPWEGRSSALYAALTAFQRTRGPLPPRWPTDVRSFGAVLSRARIALLALGVEIKRDRERPGTWLTLTARTPAQSLCLRSDATLATDAAENNSGDPDPAKSRGNPPKNKSVASVASVARKSGQSGSDHVRDVPDEPVAEPPPTAPDRATPSDYAGFMTCAICNGLFPKPPRGRPPSRCPDCRGDSQPVAGDPPIRGADGSIRAELAP